MRLYHDNEILEMLCSRLKKKLFETAEYWSMKMHLILCWTELLSKILTGRQGCTAKNRGVGTTPV